MPPSPSMPATLPPACPRTRRDATKQPGGKWWCGRPGARSPPHSLALSPSLRFSPPTHTCANLYGTDQHRRRARVDGGTPSGDEEQRGTTPHWRPTRAEGAFTSQKPGTTSPPTWTLLQLGERRGGGPQCNEHESTNTAGRADRASSYHTTPAQPD